MKTFWQQATSGYSRRLSPQDFVRFDSKGILVLSGETYQRIGKPAAVQVFYDAINRRLGLKAATPSDPGAFHVGLSKKKAKAVRVSIGRVINQFAINLPVRTRFEHPDLDDDGVLILDLSTIPPRSRPPTEQIES